jgi:hypothetical protein
VVLERDAMPMRELFGDAKAQVVPRIRIFGPGIAETYDQFQKTNP